MTGTLGYLRHLTERAGVASMNKHQTNILVGVLLGSLLAVAILLFPVFLMVGNEIYGRYEAKKQLNNPYINQHYVDWSKISLSPLDIQFRRIGHFLLKKVIIQFTMRLEKRSQFSIRRQREWTSEHLYSQLPE